MPSGTNRPQWLQATLRHTVQTDGDDMGDRPKLNFLPIFSLSDSQSGDSTNVGLDALDASGLVTLTNNTGSLAGSRSLQSGSFTTINADTTGEVQIDVGPDPRYFSLQDEFMFCVGGALLDVNGKVGELNWRTHGSSSTGISGPTQASSFHPGICRLNTDANQWMAIAPTDSLSDDQININGIQSMSWIVKMGGSITGKKVWLGAMNQMMPSGSQSTNIRFVLDQSLSGSNWLFETTPSAGANLVQDTGVACPVDTFQSLSWERIGTTDTVVARINGNVVASSTTVLGADTTKVTFGAVLSSSNGTSTNRRLDIDYFSMKSINMGGTASRTF